MMESGRRTDRLAFVGRWAKTWGVVWLTTVGLLGAPLLDEPVANLALKDGTVLREAQAKGFLAKVVLVRHEGGVRTVPYQLFPDEFQAALAAKRQAVLASAPIDRPRREAEAQKPTPARSALPAAVAAPSTASEAASNQECRVTLTRSEGNVVLLKIENVSDHVVTLLPSQFVARTRAGEEFSGASWVGIHKMHQLAAGWASHRQIAPGATVVLALVLTAPANIDDGSIETVSRKQP